MSTKNLFLFKNNFLEINIMGNCIGRNKEPEYLQEHIVLTPQRAEMIQIRTSLDMIQMNLNGLITADKERKEQEKEKDKQKVLTRQKSF